MRRPERRSYFVIYVLLLLGQVGCAGVGVHVSGLRLSDEMKARFGTIGVVSARYAPQVNYGWLPKGPAAGAAAGAWVGSHGNLLSLLTLPYFTIVGAVTARPAEEVERGEAALKSTFADTKIQDAVRDYLIELARAQTGGSLVVVSGHGPFAPSEEPDYRPLANEGIRTVLELSVLTVSLYSTSSFGEMLRSFSNPSFRLRTRVLARFVTVENGTELSHLSFWYSGRTEHKFAEWAENDAERFRQELNFAAKALAAEIVNDLSCPGPPSACEARIQEKAE